jgi:hypothetical protein
MLESKETTLPDKEERLVNELERVEREDVISARLDDSGAKDRDVWSSSPLTWEDMLLKISDCLTNTRVSSAV